MDAIQVMEQSLYLVVSFIQVPIAQPDTQAITVQQGRRWRQTDRLRALLLRN